MAGTKAYIVSSELFPESGDVIVWADTREHARVMGMERLEEYDGYLDIHAKRFPAYDEFNTMSEIAFAEQQWRDGWWFEHAPDPETATHNEFVEWYKEEYNEPWGETHA